ncbi:MAG TPA: hypothetical protein VF493_11870 [Terriglobales bacterium]
MSERNAGPRRTSRLTGRPLRSLLARDIRPECLLALAKNNQGFIYEHPDQPAA